MPLPKTDVSYAPTTAFAKAYPTELAAQNKKFNTPTWQQRTEESEPITPTEYQAPPEVHARLVEEAKARVIRTEMEQRGMLFFGAFFFAAMAYLAFRGVQWHLN